MLSAWDLILGKKKKSQARIVYEELDLKQAVERSNIKSRKYKIKNLALG